ncbi:MAG: hypothetical protein HRT42_04010 [Campylobacteraceae bacterium]|nr:hypothetical protein [Campylobacteraceae bacterium]
MLKAIFISFLLTSVLNASALMNKIENLMGEKEYRTHKNLINFLFKKESRYKSGNKILYIPLIKKLQDNGLLKLGLPYPQNIILEFKSSSDAIKTLKIFKNTLKSIGYYYYFIKKMSYKKDGQLAWTIQLKTESAINPLILSKELLRNSCKVIDITRDLDNKWTYVIDTRFGKLFEAKKVLSNEMIVLRKPLRPYFLEINANSKSIDIKSISSNIWFPYLAFYDKHLNILKVEKRDIRTKKLYLLLPENTKYIKIKDQFSLINIKRGLSITIKE